MSFLEKVKDLQGQRGTSGFKPLKIDTELYKLERDGKEELKKEIESLKTQLSVAAQKEMKLPKSDEDIEQWAEEYPDVAAEYW